MSPTVTSQRVSRISTLVRGVLSLLYLFLLSLILVPIAIFFIFVALMLQLVTGSRAPAALLQRGDRIVCYASQIADYVIMKSDQVPFPVSPFPPPSFSLNVEPDADHEEPAYADAEDITVTEISGQGGDPSATYAGGEDDTVINYDSDMDDSEDKVLAAHSSEVDEVDHESDTLLNQGALPRQVEPAEIEPDDLDETIVGGKQRDELQDDTETDEIVETKA
ncbi:MAG TPA: hypothetical protein DCF45_03320 [Gammaproteobacteria bacterium]|nr:hypothetical protein [Gammaproteobacteria bacterium]